VDPDPVEPLALPGAEEPLVGPPPLPRPSLVTTGWGLFSSAVGAAGAEEQAVRTRPVSPTAAAMRGCNMAVKYATEGLVSCSGTW
jgi:hypothetical protein